GGGGHGARAWRGGRGRATPMRRRGRAWERIVRRAPNAGKRGDPRLGCKRPMATISTPLPRPMPEGWRRWFTRRRVAVATLLGGAYGFGLAYGSWTRVCAAERCPSISRLEPGQGGPAQTSKVYAADGRLIA